MSRLDIRGRPHNFSIVSANAPVNDKLKEGHKDALYLQLRDILATVPQGARVFGDSNGWRLLLKSTCSTLRASRTPSEPAPPQREPCHGEGVPGARGGTPWHTEEGEEAYVKETAAAADEIHQRLDGPHHQVLVL